MNKKFSLGLAGIFVISFLIATPAFAQMGMMGNWRGGNTTVSATDVKINEALQDIYKTQNISEQSKVDCSKATDDQFEKLGDASMGYGITEEQHAAMENMMGGEGSSTLKQAHINMGRAYLGCWSNYKSGPTLMPMMGYSGTLAGPVHNFTNGFGMMNGYTHGYFWVCVITIILIWTVLILGITALIKWLSKKSH